MSSPPLYSFIVPAKYRLRSPDAVLTAQDYDLLQITVQDFRFVTREVTDDLTQVAADIRSRSTILRRLLCEDDLFKAGRLFRPRSDLRVKARMLDFDPLHPAMIISCGNYPWADDRLPGLSAQFAITGVPPLVEPPWSYRENADISLKEYLEGLAIGVLGTRVRRRQVVKYVADKKAAHVTDKRKYPAEQALDRAWSHLFIHIVASNGPRTMLNVVYLEMLALIRALADSESINGYIDDLAEWVSSAEAFMPTGARPSGLSLPIEPTDWESADDLE